MKQVRPVVNATPALASMPRRLIRLELAILAGLIWDLAVADEAAISLSGNPEP